MKTESSVTITLVQMDCALGKPAANFARAETMIAQAAQRGSDLVVLPELWSTAYDLEHAAAHASPLARRAGEPGWFGRLAALAQTYGVWLTGSLLEAQPDGRFYNCMALYAPDGSLAAVYRKIHLFRLMEEEIYLGPGQESTLVDLPWGKTGLAICYDLRFPERLCAARGAADGAARRMAAPAPRTLAHAAARPRHRKPVLCGGV